MIHEMYLDMTDIVQQTLMLRFAEVCFGLPRMKDAMLGVAGYVMA
jgi:hypothetical protein